VLTQRRYGDDGQLTLLVIGYTSIAALLVVAGIDASKVFLAQRALSSSADAAALAAVQAVDRPAIYAGAAGGCGEVLPIDADAAAQAVAASVADDLAALHHELADVAIPETNVESGTVTVRLSGDVAVPFGGVLRLLDPTRPDGRVHVTVTSSAESPVTAPGGC
jgi:uncharacterized membrane protein